MRWDNISSIHTTKFVKSLSVWFVVIPIFSKMSDIAYVNLVLKGFSFPFNWGVFYFASLVFFLSTFIYLVRCPEIIQKYLGWNDFERREGSYEKLIPLMQEVMKDMRQSDRESFVKRHVGFGVIRLIDDNNQVVPIDRIQWDDLFLKKEWYVDFFENSIVDTRDHVRDIYSSIREKAQSVRIISRACISILQIIGMSALAFVIFENIQAVIKYYFSI